jgi:FtsP/CotA-like multicopper oxidase with cupredoxin domain
MRKKADWRIRRPLAFVAAAAVVAAAATAGALAPGLARHASRPAGAAVSAKPQVWIAGEASHAAAAENTSVAVTSRALTTPVRAAHRGVRPNDRALGAPVRSNAARALAATQTLDWCAVAGTFDSTAIPIWGFAHAAGPGDCTGVTPELPGPQIDATAGDVVTLNVTNEIAGHTISLEVDGVVVDPASTPDAATGQTASLTFTVGEGTFLYDSSGDSGRQQMMGLYGPVVVGSGTPGQADGVSVADDETLVLSEIDPAFNADPDGFDMNNWHPSLWLINGQENPPAISAAAGAPLLLRYINAGVDHNTMGVLGLHQHMVASDGFVLANPFDAVSVTFPAGETGDALVTPAGSSGTQYALYNQNGKPGMATFIQVP